MLPRVSIQVAGAVSQRQEALDNAEAALDVASLVDRAIRTLTVVRYRYADGKIERVAPKHTTAPTHTSNA